MSPTAKQSYVGGSLLEGSINSDFDFIVPAFIDIHCHGGGGKYFSEDAQIARYIHAKNGTKFQLASLVTQDLDTLINQISMLKSADIFGIHLEGPYLSKRYCGAHDPALLRTPNLDEIKRLIEVGSGMIKMITIAPELPNAIKVIEYLVENKIVVAIGHSDANSKETRDAISAGASVVTHFNNGMAKIPTKDSLSEATLNSNLYLELIADGIHVTSENLLQIMNMAHDRIIAVTDAMSAAGCADGDYSIGNLEVTVTNKVAKLKDTETLAGSTLTMLDAFFNLNELVGLERAVQYTSLNAAKLLGLDPYENYIGIKSREITYLQ